MIALRPAAPGDLELYRNLLNILHSESAPFTRELDGVDAEETMIEGVFRNFCVGK